MATVTLRIGDITSARVDAVVNAANPAMLGGGGVDGAIHRAAGPLLLQACRRVEAVNGIRCPTGEARITPAGNLRARHVIHAVGPVYAAETQAAALLGSAYRNAFALARKYRCRTLAVPAISCGVYGYPIRKAARIALDVAAEPAFDLLDITFYLFSPEDFDAFKSAGRRQ